MCIFMLFNVNYLTILLNNVLSNLLTKLVVFERMKKKYQRREKWKIGS